jgi:S1-C subfamily serine protease
MGITILEVTSDLAQSVKLENVSGAYIASVVPDGAAANAGLREKDVIVKINDKNIGSPAQLEETLAQHHPGDQINLTYFRNGRENTASVELKNVDGTTAVVLESTGEAVFGSELVPLTSKEKEKYSIDFGAKVASLGDGKLKDLGIKNGTIISTVNGRKVNSASDVREATSAGEFISSIDGIQPNGTYFSYKFRN